MSAAASCTVADDVAAKLGMGVRAEGGEWPLSLSHYSYVASLGNGPELVEGYGCAATAPAARERAIMECLERHAQFRRGPPIACTATGAALGDSVLSPETLGLYAADQYDAPGFPFARYSRDAMLEWVQVTDAASRESRYIPAEFVYARAAVARMPLVAETSSGTAAHHSRAAALLAAICEAIERDGVLMFWHRQPPTASLSIDSSVSAEAAADLEHIRAMGFLTVICLLQYDLGIPCVLALALRGDRFAYGSACHPSLEDAADHAVRELGHQVRWQVLQSGSADRLLDLAQVRKPCDHHALYDGGAFHRSLRTTLENTIRPGAPPPGPAGPTELTDILQCLHARGYRVFECDITPSEIASCRAVVTRVLVPGLIPMYFGYDRIRLGCRRLWSREGPGRFCTLLPHFMA